MGTAVGARVSNFSSVAVLKALMSGAESSGAIDRMPFGSAEGVEAVQRF